MCDKDIFDASSALFVKLLSTVIPQIGLLYTK